MTMNVTFKRPSLELGMEVGSLKELAGYIQEEGSELSRIFGDDMEMVVRGMGGNGGETEQGTDAGGTTGTEPAKRGRKPKDKSQPDPATAAAPAPLPIPGAPVAAIDTTPNANGVPAFLDRSAAAAPPPPPPMPPAPPAAAAPPPSGILAGKVIADLDKRKATVADEGKALVEWLAAYGLVNAGSTYDESIAAVRLMPDDKLGQVATALSVA